MSFFTRKRLIWIGIIVLVVGGFVIYRTSRPSKSLYITDIVKKQDLIQTVQATGTVESSNEITLNFAATGRLVSVPVKVGDKVKAGQLLAALDSAPIRAQINSSAANVSAQQAALDKLIAGSTPEEIAVSQSAVDSAQTTLNNAKNQFAVQITTQLSTLRTTIDQQLFNTLTAIGTVDKIINSQEYANRIGAKDFATKIQAQNQILKAKQEISLNQNDLNITNISDITSAKAAVTKASNSLNVVSDALTLAYNTLIASVTDSTFTNTVLDGYKTSVQNQQQAVKASLNTLQNSLASLLNTESSYRSQIASAEQSLQSSIAQLNLKKSKATPETINQQRANLNAARATLQSLQAQLNNYFIYAPVNGVISQKNNEVGEQASTATPVIAMIGESDLQVRVDVPEADIAKIKLGDKVRMTFDAFGRDRSFDGTVSLIDPAATKIQDATYYKVKVSFTQKNPEIKSGMTADTYIITATKNSVLVIPQRAVKDNAGQKFVDVLIKDAKGQESTKQNFVTTGLRGDGGLVEIVSGLNEGETVVIGTAATAK